MYARCKDTRLVRFFFQSSSVGAKPVKGFLESKAFPAKGVLETFAVKHKYECQASEDSEDNDPLNGCVSHTSSPSSFSST